MERVEFESEDPAFAGAMTVTTTLDAQPDGTKVTILCENVPSGISQADHEAGIASTLAKPRGIHGMRPPVIGQA